MPAMQKIKRRVVRGAEELVDFDTVDTGGGGGGGGSFERKKD